MQYHIPSDAIYHSNLEEIRKHYSHCDDLQCKGYSLYTAIDGRHKHAAKELIKLGAPLDYVTENGASLFHVAAYNRSKSIMKLLHHHKVDINSIDKYCDTPLHNACKEHMYDNVKFLTWRGAINVKNNDGDYPIDLAIRSNTHIGEIQGIIEIMKSRGYGGNFLLLCSHCKNVISLKKEQCSCDFCGLMLCDSCQDCRDCGFSYCSECGKSHCVTYALREISCKTEHFSSGAECSNCGYHI